jgi:2-succinyl-5-enolpyruvyl-6-hydroxy-3-cyclohexene-1-carboxylate synthase
MNAWEPAVSAVKDCLKAGVAEFVVCGGARNAPLLEALAMAEAQDRVRVWRHFDERSAGFFALGRTMDSNEPCAVIVTSGTAVAELFPAVIEAHYQGRPLVVVSADRPARFRGTGAPQCIEQEAIFGSYAGCGRIETWNGRGPWQWNLELEESFTPAPAEFAEPAEYILARARFDAAGLARFLREDVFRGLVVMLGGLETEEREEAYHFCRALGAPVVADATSGLREALQHLVLPDGDRLLREMPPGKILRVGDIPTGRFWRELEDLPQTEVWSISRNQFTGLARPSGITTAAVNRVIRGLGEPPQIGDALDYRHRASRRAAAIDELLEAYPESEPALIRTVSIYASLASSVYLGNSLPVREWNQFAQWERPIPDVRANRGANGIDGQVSTWLGWTSDREDAWAILGDLTALYDLTAPVLLGQTTRKGRVLTVINNGGGRIFDRLPRVAALSGRAREMMLNPHNAKLEGWAAMWGMKYIRIARLADFDALEDSEEPVLLEVVPSEEETRQFWEAWDNLKA